MVGFRDTIDNSKGYDQRFAGKDPGPYIGVVKFVDDTILTLGGNSRLVVNELVYNPVSKDGKSVIKLGEGVFYYVSGKLRRENITIETPVASIGIRGTKLLIKNLPSKVGGSLETTIGVISGRAIVTNRVSGRRVNLGIGSLVKATRSGSNTIKTLDKIEALDPFVVPKAAEGAKKELEEIFFAFNICKYVKSNAIVLCNNFSTIGIGAGQPSRLDSCKIAIDKMNKFNTLKENVVAASDAFFPFVDGIEKLVQAGVNAVVQPAGSIRDKEIIKFANETGTVLVFSKTRHFRH